MFSIFELATDSRRTAGDNKSNGFGNEVEYPFNSPNSVRVLRRTLTKCSFLMLIDGGRRGKSKGIDGSNDIEGLCIGQY
jgi:hypothetical protein